MSRAYRPPPTTAVPSEDRPEGRGTGVQGHPKASWQRGVPHYTPLPLLEYAAAHCMVDAMLFVLAATSVEKHFLTHTHKTTSLTGRARTEVCKTVKVYVNNEINTYVYFL